MPAATPTVAPVIRRGPFLSYATLFNTIGWIVFAAILLLVVLPAARNGNWKPFTLPSTWLFLWKGLKETLFVGLISVVVSMVVGFLLALGRLSHIKIMSLLSSGYIELMRALPSYLIIFYVFIGFPKLGTYLHTNLLNLEPSWFAIIGLSLYTSAVMAEIFRAGILSIDKGQFEAAYSLGLEPGQTILSIVLPQAVRRMTPAIVSQLITLIKDTSLASIIALQELTRAGKQLYEYYSGVAGQKPILLETLFVIAFIYFVICYALALLSKRLEIKYH
ncbi:MAG TPA: amino acid ABC transporter permease [Chthoniobacterales bacterium]